MESFVLLGEAQSFFLEDFSLTEFIEREPFMTRIQEMRLGRSRLFSSSCFLLKRLNQLGSMEEKSCRQNHPESPVDAELIEMSKQQIISIYHPEEVVVYFVFSLIVQVHSQTVPSFLAAII
jgi:hypothetical protein